MAALLRSFPGGNRWVLWGLLVLAVLGAHGGSLRSDFYMDDRPHILMNPQVQEGLEGPAGWKSRYLTYVVWRGVQVVFGNDSRAFHAVNLLVHLATAFLFWGVARRLMRLARGKRDRWGEWVAYGGALLFAVHPLGTEPVNYAAQTSILLAVFFSLVAVEGFLRWREGGGGWCLGQVILGVLLASQAKEPGLFHALIPLALLGIWSVDRKEMRELWLGSTRGRLGLWGAGGVLAIIGVAAWAGNLWLRLRDPEVFGHHALSQGRVLWAYLGRVIFPGGLSSDHYVPWTVSWLEPWGLAGLLAGVGLGMALVWITWKRRALPAALLAIGLLQLLMRMAYPVDELMVEYRVYPSLPWFCLAIVWGVAWCGERVRGARVVWARRAMVAVMGTVALGGVWGSWQRSLVWDEESTVVLDVLGRYPDNLRAWSIHLGHLAERGDYEELVRLRNVPQEVAGRLLSPGGEPAGKGRRYMGEKVYGNYVACQFPLVKALIHVGQLGEAQRRADMLLVDVLRKLPSKNHKSVFTALLAKLLVHTAAGRPDEVEATLAAVESVYDDQETLRRYLREEAALLPSVVAGVGSGDQD